MAGLCTIVKIILLEQRNRVVATDSGGLLACSLFELAFHFWKCLT